MGHPTTPINNDNLMPPEAWGHSTFKPFSSTPVRSGSILVTIIINLSTFLHADDDTNAINLPNLFLKLSNCKHNFTGLTSDPSNRDCNITS